MYSPSEQHLPVSLPVRQSSRHAAFLVKQPPPPQRVGNPQPPLSLPFQHLVPGAVCPDRGPFASPRCAGISKPTGPRLRAPLKAPGLLLFSNWHRRPSLRPPPHNVVTTDSISRSALFWRSRRAKRHAPLLSCKHQPIPNRQTPRPKWCTLNCPLTEKSLPRLGRFAHPFRAPNPPLAVWLSVLSRSTSDFPVNVSQCAPPAGAGLQPAGSAPIEMDQRSKFPTLQSLWCFGWPA